VFTFEERGKMRANKKEERTIDILINMEAILKSVKESNFKTFERKF
jgi:hypothetical protein